MDIVNRLCIELGLKKNHVENVIEMIEKEGYTIPFIARYRKEKTGEMSDTMLREFGEKLTYLRNLESRKEDVLRLIEEQGKLDEDIQKAVDKANTLQEVEDIYAPYKKKKRTRATIAKEKGLEDLANSIVSGDKSVEKYALEFIDAEKEVNTVEEAIAGAKDIIAEQMSDDAETRKSIRRTALERGKIATKGKTEEDSVYSMYYEFSKPIKYIEPHNVLAINRGEKEGFLSVKLELDDERLVQNIVNKYKKNKGLIHEIAEDSYKRLIFPSIEREVRNHLTEIAQERAIKVFGKNLTGLLLQPPIKDVVVLGLDPAFRTGCKIAVVDKNGKLLGYDTLYLTDKNTSKVREGKKTLEKMLREYKVDIVSIGNGTASRESEQIVAEIISGMKEEISYVIVNEAGASVYSASELACEEHPDINVSIRGAISIARRLQDPMAELVKIEPKSIGVGQYQHDLNEKRLVEVLDGVVEDSVNKIGVDLNTASYSLLSHIAGISKTVAKNIVIYRDENGEFEKINDIKNVKRLGPAAFKQAAGFVRILNSKNPLDNTGVHPESYKACKQALEILGYSPKKIGNLEGIDEKIKSYGLENLAKDVGIGEATLRDIIEEVKKPGRDIRDSGVKPVLRTDVMTFDDLKEDMVLMGTVRNVVDFGAFVDIGIKSDGLVHRSQIPVNKKESLTVGDVIKVRVSGKDEKRGRVSLSMLKIEE